jgi:uncharacterized protein
LITAEAVRAYYAHDDPTHDFDHVLRVLRLAEHIGRAEGADLAVASAAALLHDVARGEAGPGVDHAALAEARVHDLLAGQPPALVAAVAHAVAAHRFRGGPEPDTLEARVLFDADKLDAIGAIGIARAFAYSGRHGRPLWADLPLPGVDVPEGAPPPGALPSAESSSAYSTVHEFVYKLSRLRDRLYTPTGRALAAERHAFMVAFFVRLRAEVRG